MGPPLSRGKSAMKKPQIDLTGARVLLVDDTSENLRLLRLVLESGGYSILVATSGEAALRVARSAHPHLILLDVQMPGMDGFETCRRLKEDETTQAIPVIFVTVMTETESVIKGFHAGGIDYIVKPFNEEEVLARVQTHLKIDRLTRKLEASNRALSAANRQVQEQTRRKSDFLASMSHELRTPMNAIIGFTGMVLRRTGDILPELQKQNLEKVTHSAHRLLNLINELLDLSKIEAGRMDVDLQRFNVKEMIAACCASVAPLVKPAVELKHEVSNRVGEARTDAERLRQIVTNLLSNALKFTEKGEVTVRVSVDEQADGDGTLVVAVSDTGSGIPADALETIFDEFQQVKGSDPQHKGTGLGLAITKRFTQLLGGAIAVQSEVGKGSTFTVRIPVVYKQTEPDRDI